MSYEPRKSRVFTGLSRVEVRLSDRAIDRALLIGGGCVQRGVDIALATVPPRLEPITIPRLGYAVVSLSEEMIDYAEFIGDGKLSVGIERVLYG